MLILKTTTNRLSIQYTVGLSARRAHRMSLAGIQNAKLYPGFIGRRRHRTTQRVDLLDQMAFADAADRRIAGHLAERFDVMRKQQRAPAHARAGERRFGAGVTATNHDYVKFFREMHAFSASYPGRNDTRKHAGNEMRDSHEEVFHVEHRVKSTLSNDRRCFGKRVPSTDIRCFT